MKSALQTFLYYFPLFMMLLIALLVFFMLVVSLFPAWFSRFFGPRPPRIHRTQHRPNRYGK